jgi:hypothetical protein
MTFRLCPLPHFPTPLGSAAQREEQGLEIEGVNHD